MALPVSKRLGELVIGGISLHTPAWKIHDVVHFWFDSALSGDVEPIPGMDGGLDAPMWQSSAVIAQTFSMVGDVNHEGDRFVAADGYDARAIGLASNTNFLRSNVLTGRVLTGARTREATLQVPGESTPREATVQVWMEPGAVNNEWLFQTTLYVRIAAGAFL